MVALAGRPNVGKSTLANALSGHHVAAVSPRPQTTRRRLAVAVHGDDWQAVLLDIPGFQTPRDGLTRRMQATVDATLQDCDAALLVVSADEPVGSGDRFIVERLLAARLPVMVVVNKTDTSDPKGIADSITRIAAQLPDMVALHPVSALTGDGLGELRADLATLLPEGPAYFPPGMATDQTMQELAAELIREAALVRLRDEVPHAMAVHIEDITPARQGIRVEAVVYVENDSQKGIVVGKGGQMVRDIGSAARRALGVAWGEEVHLDLMVKVRRRWRNDESMLTRLGI